MLEEDKARLAGTLYMIRTKIGEGHVGLFCIRPDL